MILQDDDGSGTLYPDVTTISSIEADTSSTSEICTSMLVSTLAIHHGMISKASNL